MTEFQDDAKRYPVPGTERDEREAWEILDRLDNRTELILELIILTRGEVRNLTVDQQTFDTDLAGLVSSISSLIGAVNNLVQSKGAVDLTAEDQSVLDATRNVAAELAAITPPPAGTSSTTGTEPAPAAPADPPPPAV